MTGLELAPKRSIDSAQNIAAKEFAAKILKRLVLRVSNGWPAGAAKSILRGCWRISSSVGTVPVWDGMAVEDKVSCHRGGTGKGRKIGDSDGTRHAWSPPLASVAYFGDTRFLMVSVALVRPRAVRV